jgi:hypothetical protein
MSNACIITDVIHRSSHTFKAVCGILAAIITSAHSASIDEDVDKAIAEARLGDYGLVSELMAVPSRGEQMKHLRKYVTDASENIREIVAVMATGVRTREALEILADLLADSDVDGTGWRAEDGLFADFTCEQLVAWGGNKLKQNLLSRPKQAKGLIMLGCFGGNPDVINYLQQVRQRTTGLIAFYEYGAVVDSSEGLDLALAITGDAKSSARVVTRIRASQLGRTAQYSDNESSIQSMLFILGAIKFIDNERILNELLDLLDDTRPALPYGPAHGGDSRMIRLCDLTLTVLAKKLNIDPRFPIESDVPLPYTPIPRFTEWQRERAHRLFKTHFRKQNFLPARNT